MTDSVSEVSSLLIPLHNRQLLLPQSNVLEVASFDTLEDSQGHAPWLLGSVEWEGSLVPVVSFEGLCGDDIAPTTGQARVVLFRCLTDALSSRAFGIVSAGLPQLVRVSEPSLDVVRSEHVESLPVLCQVSMNDKSPIIPDIEKIEQLIDNALAAAR